MAKFNLDYRIGADLRETPDDPASMQAYVDFLTDQIRKLGEIKADNARVAVKFLGEIGAYAKILRKPEMALAALEKSLAFIERFHLGPSVWAVHTIRYGDALRFKKDPLAAETAFRSVLEMKSREPELADIEDFAWQHLGKLKFEEGDFSTAKSCFEKALELRRRKGVPELIQSTEKALQVLRMKGKL